MSLRVLIDKVTDEAEGIRTLRLVREDGAPFTPFIAGAHIDVTGPTGVLRQYSLSSDPGDMSSIRITVKKEEQSRGGSDAIHTLGVGDHLLIGKPRNLLAVAPGADQHVLIGGGIGVTPLLSMAFHLWSQGEDFTLHYLTRSEETTAYKDLLRNRAEFRERVRLHVGITLEEQAVLREEIAATLTPESHVYTCGPAGFMEVMREAFAPIVGDDHVHIEHFVAEETDDTGNTPFLVELDSGEEFEIPADRSILQVLEANGIDVFKSCEEGICGSCVSGVLEGTPDHRDHCLSQADKAAGQEMAICVSRALTDKLVIELY